MALLTGSTIVAIRKSWADDDAAVRAFAVALYATLGLVLLFYCLRRFDRAQIGLGGELFKMGLGIAACDAALAHHHARGGAGSLAFVFIAYAGFVTLTWRFLRRFDGGHVRGAGGGQ